jgi:MOSC domain-containing protein
VPVVSRISIAPVKGLALVHPDEVTLEQTGVAANRRFHIVDADGRRYNQLRNGQLVRIRPDYDPESEQLTLRFPNGTVADGTIALGEEITTDFYGRPVTGNVVIGPWSDALSTWAGRPLRLVRSAPGVAVDRRRGNVSLVSTASLAELARHGGQTEPVDGRRFRMLFELDDCEPHEEDRWVKRHLRIGDAVVYVRNDVGRCAITTQNPETGVPDFDTLRTISRYRELTPNEAGKKHIPFGVFGEVVETGRVAVGDTAEAVELSLLA